MSDTTEVVFRFNCSAPGVGPETFHLIRLSGYEAISELYEFTVDLVSTEAELDPANFVLKRATVEIEQAGESSFLHGIVSSFELLGRDKAWVHYRAVMVPSLWLLERSFQSQIFLEKDVKTIVEDVLKESELKPDDDFSISLTGTYPKLEYVVQYEETDLAFVRRWLEHYGIFFYFEHGEKKEKLVIRDAKDAHAKIREDYVVPFREPSGLVHGEEAVTELSFRQRVVTKSVLLKDYNYRKPSLEIKGEATAAAKGFGGLIEYGNHFKDPEEGKALAQVRGEEIACREKIFAGRSTCFHFRSGHKFKLADHYVGSSNAELLLTEAQHVGEQPGPMGASGGATSSVPAYANEFRAIPLATPFRPARITPKPRISGVMHAVVDAGGSGQYAEIDDQGRYKVKLPFDLSDATGGKASRWVRMAQPYSGGGMGFHFPLHKGTEVLLYHIDGDPDRPIIAASVPNPETGSPVTGSNQTQCVIHTGGGNKIVIEDTGGGERIAMSSPHGNSFLSIGAPPA